MYHPYPDDRSNAINRAQIYVSLNPVFVDTETTGLSGDDEICEIAVVDLAGNVLINSLVKPTKPIPQAASEVHGITNEMVAGAPTFRDVLPKLNEVLHGRTVLVYNLEFDEGKIVRSAVANGCKFDFGFWAHEVDPGVYDDNWHCAMELYSAFYGEWNDYHGNYRWQRLANAARQCGITLPAGIHRAHADAEMTRQIVAYIAAQTIEETQPGANEIEEPWLPDEELLEDDDKEGE